MDNYNEEIRELRDTIEHLIARVKHLERTLINEPEEVAKRINSLENLLTKFLVDPEGFEATRRDIQREFKNGRFGDYGQKDNKEWGREYW